MTVVSGLRRRSLGWMAIVAAIMTATCTDSDVVQPTTTPPETPPSGSKPPAGVYEFTITGIGTADMQASAVQVYDAAGNYVKPADGVQASLNPVTSGLVFEVASIASYIEGGRTNDGQRYITITYRVGNQTGGPLTNVTMIPNETTGTIPGTPWSQLRLFNNAAADPAIAQKIVPTGATVMGEDFRMLAPYADVLQVFTEAEIAAITPPVGVTSMFPYGFVVRNARTNTTRTLPVAVDAHDFSGMLTFAFRFPTQPTSAADPFSFTFQATAVQDTETRMTESYEEAGDTVAVRRLRERATALGATTVTVLGGSAAMDPFVADYPGMRQICTVRTAGSAGSPTQFINTPGAYSYLSVLYPGESLSTCSPYFRTGAAARPATNVSFPVTIVAMDRYGNVKTGIAENVRLENTGAPATLPGPTTMAGGTTSTSVTYTDYGNARLIAIANRIRDGRNVSVLGITRTWTAGAGTTSWHTGANWALGAVPMSLDSVIIPVAAPLDPVLSANVTVLGVRVEDTATLGLNAFDLTAGGDVFAGTTGGITNTVGRLILTGTAKTVQGLLPRVRVTGTYSLSGNITTRAPLDVAAGRLTNSTFRVQSSGF